MANIQRSRDGKSWVLDWTDPDGARRRPIVGKCSTMSEREAKLILKAKELELATGQRLISTSSSRAHTFAALAPRYLAWRADKYPASQPRIERNLRHKLLPYFGRLVLEAITQEAVDKYLAERAATGLRAATIIKELDTLKAMFKKALEWRLIAHDVVQYVAKPEILDSKPPHYYTVAQLQQLYAVNSAHTEVWRLIANTGMRRAEALNLKFDDTQGGVVNILSTGVRRTKSAKWRPVPIGPGAETALTVLKELAREAGSDYVVPVRSRHISYAFKCDAIKAGLPGSIHSLRHTFITHLILRGKPLRVVQKLAGHSSIAVTERYAHVSPDFLQRATLDLDI